MQAWKIAQEYSADQAEPALRASSRRRPGAPGGYFDMGLLTSSGTPRGSYFKLGSWIQEAVADRKVKAPGPCSAC